MSGVLSDDCQIPASPSTTKPDSATLSLNSVSLPSTQPDPSIQSIPLDAKKLFLTSENPEIKLSLMNPFAIKHAIVNTCGDVENIQFLKTGDLFVTCVDNNQL